MQRPILLLAAMALIAGAPAPALAAPLPGPVAAAAADPARAADRAIDARRHGPELMAFARVKRGDKVLELIPGSGYFTRLFSRIVGPGGHVYAIWPQPYADEAVPDVNALKAASAKAPWTNISVMVQPAARLTVPEPVDVVFTSQNYHDYPDKFMGRIDPMVLNRAVYKALKPGGYYIIVDHAAEAGSGMRDTDTLHRIDPEIVKKQVLAAGFRFDGESQLLRNPADTHKLLVFNPAIRGRTDQFIYRFRKP
jgi:predicted methyltransferase